MAEIYLAGGCFWGLEKYLSEIKGVISTEVGYANGKKNNPSYEEVCQKNTGHAETVKVEYDSEVLPLDFLLELFLEVINPFSLNKQGNDIGEQYRTGIYYLDDESRLVAEEIIATLQAKSSQKVMIEVKGLENYSKAEEYHQKYLDKNPQGYCHIGKDMFTRAANAVVNPAQYRAKAKAELKKELSPLQYAVTMENGTEPPYNNEYNQEKRAGIYVDITTGEPMFSSRDKYDSTCGWPSFTKPLDDSVLREKRDLSHGMIRTEVRSRVGDAHLGHVFNDGPREKGGLRYCINSAALRFIPREEMEKEGYGKYLYLLEN